jgi:hypothetical protein
MPNNAHITIPRLQLYNILANAIVYADYIAGNHNCQIVRQGARSFSAECEQQLAEIQKTAGK